MTSNSEEPAHGDPFERRLAAFDRHKDDLVAILQKVCERRAKPFDKNGAWRLIRIYAWSYLKGEARAKEKQKMVPAADRSKSLRQLGNTLRQARCMIGEAHIRYPLFVEWCEAHGNPDFTDPIMGIFETKFDKVVAGLADLETAAFRAAEQVRQKLGRPRGTGVLQQDFIIGLELAYRDITGKPGGRAPDRSPNLS